MCIRSNNIIFMFRENKQFVQFIATRRWLLINITIYLLVQPQRFLGIYLHLKHNKDIIINICLTSHLFGFRTPLSRTKTSTGLRLIVNMLMIVKFNAIQIVIRHVARYFAALYSALRHAQKCA